MTTPPTPPTPSAAQERYGRAGEGTRRLAVFGPRGSGKTCYFASLYGHSFDEVSALTFGTDATTAYLLKMWNMYESPKGVPDPTPNEVPERMCFDAANAGRQWAVEVLDHAGALAEDWVDRAETRDIKQAFHDWLRECEGVIVFLDAGADTSGLALRRRDEVAKLLELLREEAEGRRVTRPLVLALTKYDQHGAHDPQAVQRYFLDNPQFRQIHRTLEQFGDRVRTFAVSAMGEGHVLGGSPKRPFNLLPPLVWLLEQSDEVRFGATELAAARLPAGRAVAAFERLIAAGMVRAGPVHARAVEAIARLRARRRTQRLRGAAAAAACSLAAVALAGTAWLGAGAGRYSAYATFCDSPEGQGDEKAGTRVAEAAGLLAWYGPVLSAPHCDRLRSDMLRDREAVRDHEEMLAWNAIAASRDGLDALDPPLRLEALRRVEGAVRAFGEGHGGRKSGQDWRAALAANQLAQVSDAAGLDGYNAALAEDARLAAAGSHGEAVTAWSRYLKGAPAPYYARRAAEAVGGRKVAADDERFRVLNLAAAGERFTPQKCLAHLDLFDAFRAAAYDLDRFAAPLERLAEAALADADAMAYGEAQRALRDAKAGRAAAALLAARGLVSSYLLRLEVRPGSPHRRSPAMQAEAAQAKAWLDAFADGRTYPMRLKSMFVPKGHFLYDNNIFKSVCSGYSIVVSGAADLDAFKGGGGPETERRHTTYASDGVTVDMSVLQLAATDLKYTPGACGPLLVLLHRNGYGGRYVYPNTGPLAVPGEVFQPAELESGLKFAYDGKELVLKFDCGPAATVPTLPDYRRK